METFEFDDGGVCIIVGPFAIWKDKDNTFATVRIGRDESGALLSRHWTDDPIAAALTWIHDTCTATLTALGDAS